MGFSKVVVKENKFLWLFFSLREKAEGFSGGARGKRQGAGNEQQVERRDDRPSRKSKPHWRLLLELRKETSEVRSLA